MVGLRVLATFWVLVLTAVASLNNSNGTTTTEYQLKEMQETISDLQKHILAQEQKQTAVLSSVLSQLTETKEELASLQFNYTVLETELSSFKEKCTSVDGAGKSCRHLEIGFEASMSNKFGDNHTINVPAYSNLIFPIVQYNQGGCWNSSNGVFTATVNGTYQFWIALTFTGVKDVNLSMKKNGKGFGQTHGSQHNGDDTDMISLTSLTPLVEGDRVYFTTNKAVKYKPNYSSCGGVLIYPDIQFP